LAFLSFLSFLSFSGSEFSCCFFFFSHNLSGCFFFFSFRFFFNFSFDLRIVNKKCSKRPQNALEHRAESTADLLKSFSNLNRSFNLQHFTKRFWEINRITIFVRITRNAETKHRQSKELKRMNKK
jgi:hypothetical protein